MEGLLAKFQGKSWIYVNGHAVFTGGGVVVWLVSKYVKVVVVREDRKK